MTVDRGNRPLISVGNDDLRAPVRASGIYITSLGMEYRAGRALHIIPCPYIRSAYSSPHVPYVSINHSNYGVYATIVFIIPVEMGRLGHFLRHHPHPEAA